MASYEGCTQIIDPLCECQNQVGIKGRAREARWEAAGNVNTPPSSIMKRHCGSCHCSCLQVTEKLTVSKYKSLIAVILKPSTVIRGKRRGVALNAFLPNQCCKLRYLIAANCCLLRNAFSQMQAVLGSEQGDQIQSYTVLCPRRAKKSMSIFFSCTITKRRSQSFSKLDFSAREWWLNVGWPAGVLLQVWRYLFIS